jgi:hypothetical protein
VCDCDGIAPHSRQKLAAESFGPREGVELGTVDDSVVRPSSPRGVLDAADDGLPLEQDGVVHRVTGEPFAQARTGIAGKGYVANRSAIFHDFGSPGLNTNFSKAAEPLSKQSLDLV